MGVRPGLIRYTLVLVVHCLGCLLSVVCVYAGYELDKTKRLCEYSFTDDPQSGMCGHNLTNVVFVRRQIGGAIVVGLLVDC